MRFAKFMRLPKFPLATALAVTAAALFAVSHLLAFGQMRNLHPTDATTVPTMMGAHMQMSIKTPVQPGDADRAAHIADIARSVIAHYKNVETAEHDGYHPFLVTGKMGEEVHYINPRLMAAENRNEDYHHPGSLLYERTPNGMKATGVMYVAPANANADQLNARAPLSIAPWHRHVDLCVPPTRTGASELVDPKAQFGFLGTIHSDAECRAANGHWVPLAFGWMTHVYPNEPDPTKVWGGAKMMMTDDMDM
jgi:hypothetical protein